MLSPIPYYGSKTQIAGQIVSLFPDHTRYVEPYCGSLSVLLAKPPSRHEIVNDLDQHLMVFWRVLRDQPEELARVCLLTPHARSERDLARQLPDDLSDLERARRVWSALAQGRHGTLTNTGWRRDDYPLPRMMRAYVKRMESVAERLRGVSLECRPALDVIERYGSSPDTAMYVDPPYLGSTRSRNYRTEMMGEQVHRELSEALTQCRATVVLSGYHSPLYDELYAGWFRHELPSQTTQGSGSRHRVEVLWSNREFRHTDPQLEPVRDETLCGFCGVIKPVRATGRPAKWCSPQCRTAVWREKNRFALTAE